MKNNKHISIFLYYLSLSTWILNICLLFLPFFVDLTNLGVVLILLVFVSAIFQAMITGAFGDEELVPKIKRSCKFIDYCLKISKYVSFSLVAISFVSLLIGGGGPDIVEDAYCLVNHGEIVRYISYGWFWYFVICELLLYTCITLYFSTYMAMRVRALYLIGNSKKD